MCLKVIPSLIRLQRLDNQNGLAGNVPGDAPKPLLASLRPLPVNGKGGITGRGVPAQQGQLPRELIKTRPQVVGELADQQRDLVGDDIQLKASDVHSLFYLIMFRDSYCLMTKKPLNSFLQSLEVYFRPQGFYAGVS